MLLWRKTTRAGPRGETAADLRMRRLAESIDALADKDDRLVTHANEIGDLRRAAAAELHQACAGFVDHLNGMLTRGLVVLDPPVFSEETYSDNTANLLQINVRGRILQIEFRAIPELVSTEDFRIPYILAGSIRAFNQALLDKDLIEEQLLFYTLEKDQKMWRFFDARTYRSGPFDKEYLAALMEELV